MIAVENVVAQDQANGGTADKFFTDQEGLRNAFGFRLLGIAELNTQVGSRRLGVVETEGDLVVLR